jgi:hypothetical protein
MPARLILQETDGHVQVLLHRDGHLIPEPSGAGISFEPPLSPEEREVRAWVEARLAENGRSWPAPREVGP